MTCNKILLVLAKLATVILIFVLIFRRIPPTAILPLITPQLCFALFTAVALNLAQAAVCTWRWLALARGVKEVPGFSASFVIYMEGLFFNQALPSFIVGDAVRVARWTAVGVSAHDALVSVLRDRLFGAIGAGILAVIACILLWRAPIENIKITSAVLLTLAVVAGSTGLLFAMQSRRLALLFRRFERIRHSLHRISAARLDLRSIAHLTGNAVFGQLLAGLSICVIARSLGIELPFTLLVSVTGIILVVSMIPISLAGWGIREASFLSLLVPLGVKSENVMLLSVTFGLAGLLSGLLGGFSILARWRRTWSRYSLGKV